MLENLFGELANDLSIKNLIQRLSKFSFDNTSQLRTVTSGSVSVSGSLTTVSAVSTVSTVTNVTTANMSIGDMGKASAAQLQSAQGFYGSVGANFIRS